MKKARDRVQQFCSRKCASVFLFSKQETRKCLTCNNNFQTTPSHNYHYCSRLCAHKSRIKTYIRKCKRCGAEFKLKNIAYERRGGGQYCSSSCAMRIYDFNEKYFEKINTPEQAYWFGFLLADGNVYKDQMTLKLQRTDSDHLLKFKKAMSSEHPIHLSQKEMNGKTYYYAVFFIGSKKLCHDLLQNGMPPKKSLILKYPIIPSKLQSHFIRGYFDGDGCIYVNTNKNNHKVWSIYSGSEDVVVQMKNILENRLNIKTSIYKQGKGFVLAISKKEYINKIFKFLYKNCDPTIYLERKHDKFLL